MAANTPPLPHNEGDTFTNEETGIKYQFINGAWRAVSSQVLENILDSLGEDFAYLSRNQKFTGDNIFEKNISLTDIPRENTHATNKFYTDALDTVVHGMIDVIIGRKVYAKYRLQKDDRSLRAGNFKLLTVPLHDSEASQANDWEDVNYIYLDSRDYDGNRRAMTELKVGMQLSMETPRGAATFIIIETGVNGSDYMFRLQTVSFLGDPEDDLVYQMVAGEEGKLTAEEVGDIVLNRFNATDAVRNSYGKFFRIDRFYDPTKNIGNGRFSWDSVNNTLYLSKIDMNNFQWSSNASAGDLPGPCFFSIYDPALSGGSIGSVKLRGTFERFEATTKHCALSKVTRVQSSTLLDGDYIINLGGFM